MEHVLPQNPKKGSAWLEAFGEEERAFWTHRMANLVLLNRAKNSQAQNYDFETKKERYFSGSTGAAPFVLTIQVLQQAEWTPDVLKARQEELLQVLQSEWKL